MMNEGAEDFREEQRRLQEEEDQSQDISNFAGLRDSTSFPLAWDARLNLSRMCLDSATCAKDLENLGLDVLKDELAKLGMKCGGSLQERAERLWQSRGISDLPMFLREHPELVPVRDKEKRSRFTM
jgi:hypothetical protein